MKITHILYIMTMNTRSLRNLLTIVIPSKNEGKVLYDCIYHISEQFHIAGVRVIIADVSDEFESLNYIERIRVDFKYNLKIRIGKIQSKLLFRINFLYPQNPFGNNIC